MNAESIRLMADEILSDYHTSYYLNVLSSPENPAASVEIDEERQSVP